MNVVADTNVLISGLVNPKGIPGKILNLALNGKIVLLYDNRIIREYADVLSREKFGFSSDLILPVMDFIQNDGIYISAEPIKKEFQDEEDKKFYEVAITGDADYLITGNIKHFPKDPMVISPSGFLLKW